MLTRQVRNELLDALDQTFDLAGLKILLFRLNKDIESVAVKGSRPSVIVDIISAAEQEGWDADLLLAASQVRPRSEKLRALVEQTFVPTVEPQTARLQRQMHAQVPDLSPVQARLRQEATEPRVCAIEIRGDHFSTGGTGFLVGPDLVLTACHVIQPALNSLRGIAAKFVVTPDRVTLRFDYKQLQGSAVSFGVYYKLHADWLVAFSPESPVDTAEKPDRDPTLDELDYALLRLESAAGSHSIGASMNDGVSPRRGWIGLPELADYVPQSPLQILHHGVRPDGRALTLSLDMRSIIGLNRNGTRLLHQTNTYDGSSGAPCFDALWQLIALHHGVAGGVDAPNRAIPIPLIARALHGKIDLPPAPPLP